MLLCNCSTFLEQQEVPLPCLCVAQISNLSKHFQPCGCNSGFPELGHVKAGQETASD